MKLFTVNETYLYHFSLLSGTMDGLLLVMLSILLIMVYKLNKRAERMEQRLEALISR